MNPKLLDPRKPGRKRSSDTIRRFLGLTGLLPPTMHTPSPPLPEGGNGGVATKLQSESKSNRTDRQTKFGPENDRHRAETLAGRGAVFDLPRSPFGGSDLVSCDMDENADL